MDPMGIVSRTNLTGFSRFVEVEVLSLEGSPVDLVIEAGNRMGSISWVNQKRADFRSSKWDLSIDLFLIDDGLHFSHETRTLLGMDQYINMNNIVLSIFCEGEDPFNNYFEVHQGSYKWDRTGIHIAPFPVSKSHPR